jgi:hypothetical protein
MRHGRARGYLQRSRSGYAEGLQLLALVFTGQLLIDRLSKLLVRRVRLAKDQAYE